MTKSIDVYIEPFRVTITTCARQQVNRVRKQTANVKRSNDLLCSVISSNVSLKSIVSFLILLFPSLAIIPEGILHPRPPRPPRKNSEFEPNFLPFLFPFSRVQRPDLSNRSGDLLRPSRYHVRSERIRRVLDGSLAAGARAGGEGEGERGVNTGRTVIDTLCFRRTTIPGQPRSLPDCQTVYARELFFTLHAGYLPMKRLPTFESESDRFCAPRR